MRTDDTLHRRILPYDIRSYDEALLLVFFTPRHPFCLVKACETGRSQVSMYRLRA